MELSNGFGQRHARWREIHRLAGAGRSYPHAWRLPELARPLGGGALALAQEALALDLYCLGRFPESLAALPGAHAGPLTRILGARLRLLLMSGPLQAPLVTDVEAAYLHYLLGEAVPGDWPGGDSEEQRLWSTLLAQWSRPGADPATGHLALARLRRIHPSLAAQGEAMLAEAAYRRAPRWSVAWLDHALEAAERFSQHHLKARLMGLKARALAAAGELGASERFRRQALVLAGRQGARLYVERFIDRD